MRVLVVEDDPLIREFVVEALREEGFHVVHAADGEEALEWCRRRFADVLVTDIRLPGKVDGWQIAERCREHDPDIPVIYATGFFAGGSSSRGRRRVSAEAIPPPRDREGRQAGDRTTDA